MGLWGVEVPWGAFLAKSVWELWGKPQRWAEMEGTWRETSRLNSCCCPWLLSTAPCGHLPVSHLCPWPVVPGAVFSHLRPVRNATAEAVTAPFSSCRMSRLLPHPRAADCDSAPEHHDWGHQRRNISAVLTKNQPADTSLEHGRRGGSLALQTSLLLPSKYCSQHWGFNSLT